MVSAERLVSRPISRASNSSHNFQPRALTIAKRGAIVVGVDQSETLLSHAEKNRGDLPAERLRYFRRDLRQPLPEGGFDAAFNVFSSIGY